MFVFLFLHVLFPWGNHIPRIISFQLDFQRNGLERLSPLSLSPPACLSSPLPVYKQQQLWTESNKTKIQQAETQLIAVFQLLMILHGQTSHLDFGFSVFLRRCSSFAHTDSVFDVVGVFKLKTPCIAFLRKTVIDYF